MVHFHFTLPIKMNPVIVMITNKRLTTMANAITQKVTVFPKRKEIFG